MSTSSSITECLSLVSLFQDLNPADLNEIASKCFRKKFKSEESILIFDQEGHSFYIIASGKVSIKAIDPGMREKVLLYLEPGNFFGEMSAIDNERRSADVIAENDVEVLILSQKDFLELLQKYPSIHMALSREFCRRLRLIDHRLSCVSLPVHARVACAMISLSNEHGKMTKDGLLLPKITQSEIGKISDSPRETVNRAISSLKEKGLISVTDSKQFLIPDLDTLNKWIKEESE